MRMNGMPAAAATSPRPEAAAGAPLRPILVVYFSRRGHTRTMARLIAAQCGAETEEIVDGIDRRGPLGYLRSVLEAVLRRPAAIQPSRYSPRDYDTVIIGTPVWAWHLASPVRAYLCRHRGRFRRVAFFCCHRGWGHGAALDEVARLCARAPAATLALSDREVAQGRYRSSLSRFVRSLRAMRQSRRNEAWRQTA